jgi:3-isopropylmalate dehydrogenase
MRRYRIGVLDGDGIGPEIMAATLRVLDAAVGGLAGSRLDLVELPVGYRGIAEFGRPVPRYVLEALDRTDGWIMGPHDMAGYPRPHDGVLSPTGELRKRFDLYANISPAKLLGAGSRHADEGDLVVVRENTQGFYADRNTFAGTGEWMPSPDVAIAQGVFTRPAVARVARVACRLAAQRRRRLTIVHKANVLRLTSGLFRDVCRDVATEYPELVVDEVHFADMAVALLRRPAEFDVVVTENLFGDLLADLAAEVCGSSSVAGSLNAGERHAMAQAAHGSAPDIAGRDLANPTALILATALLLRWLAARHGDASLVAVAARIEGAVGATIEAGRLPLALGGTSGTREFADAVCATLPKIG